MATTQVRGGNNGTGTSQIKPASLDNSDVHASAAIALTKLAQVPITPDGATAFTADQSMGSHKLTNVTDPTNAQDAATKAYVDAAAVGLKVKAPVECATTAALNTYDQAGAGVGATLTKNTNGSINSEAVDGVTLVVGDRVLVKNESGANAPFNGIYTVTVVGSGSVKWVLTRATDFDQASEDTEGAFFFVIEGTTNAGTGWVQTLDVTTVDTDNISFTQFSTGTTYTAGNGILFTGTVISVKLDGATLAEGASGLKVAYLFVTRETPSGTLNGSNVTFTLANTPVSGSEELYLNGLLQDAGGGDYSISGGTITMVVAPISTDKLRCSYRY